MYTKNRQKRYSEVRNQLDKRGLSLPFDFHSFELVESLLSLLSSTETQLCSIQLEIKSSSQEVNSIRTKNESLSDEITLLKKEKLTFFEENFRTLENNENTIRSLEEQLRYSKKQQTASKMLVEQYKTEISSLKKKCSRQSDRLLNTISCLYSRNFSENSLYHMFKADFNVKVFRKHLKDLSDLTLNINKPSFEQTDKLKHVHPSLQEALSSTFTRPVLSEHSQIIEEKEDSERINGLETKNKLLQEIIDKMRHSIEFEQESTSDAKMMAHFSKKLTETEEMLNHQITFLNEDNNKLKRENKGLRARLDKFRETKPFLLELETELKRNVEEKLTLEVRLASLQADLGRKEDELKKMSNRLEKSEERLEIKFLKEELKKAREAHFKTHEVLKRLEEKLRESSAKLESERLAGVESVRKYERIVSDLRENIVELAEEKDRNVFERREYEERIKELHVKVMRVETALMDSEERRISLENAQEERKNKVTELKRLVKIQENERKKETDLLEKKLRLAEDDCLKLQQALRIKRSQVEMLENLGNTVN